MTQDFSLGIYRLPLKSRFGHFISFVEDTYGGFRRLPPGPSSGSAVPDFSV